MKNFYIIGKRKTSVIFNNTAKIINKIIKHDEPQNRSLRDSRKNEIIAEILQKIDSWLSSHKTIRKARTAKFFPKE
jgi:hypothetical protein